MPDAKLTALTQNSTPLGGDFMYIVDDPGGVPLSQYLKLLDFPRAIMPVDGFVLNGRISATVAGNNLTLALKTMAGTDPSAADPVIVRIGDTYRIVTAALSVTKNAATNWCNAGSPELATKEIDYFAYLGYNATDGVVIGFSRIPYARIYSDFSTTSTNEKYAGISTITNAAASDPYVVIGRFAATLSAGAGYTWTVPTYTALNLIQRPIYMTRKLNWAPQVTYAGGTTNPTSVVVNTAFYQVNMNSVFITTLATLTRGTGDRTNTLFSMPFTNSALTNVAGMDSINGATLKMPTVDYWSADNLLHHVQTMTSDGNYWDSGWAFIG